MPHTHDVTVCGDLVRKSYVRWDKGEPDREWAALLSVEDQARQVLELLP